MGPAKRSEKSQKKKRKENPSLIHEAGHAGYSGLKLEHANIVQKVNYSSRSW